jgi:archaeal cell division control protein 6
MKKMQVHRGRVADFISELDVLGVITARVISWGRYGKTRKIQVMIPSTKLEHILQEDEHFTEITQIKIKNQMKIL